MAHKKQLGKQVMSWVGKLNSYSCWPGEGWQVWNDRRDKLAAHLRAQFGTFYQSKWANTQRFSSFRWNIQIAGSFVSNSYSFNHFFYNAELLLQWCLFTSTTAHLRRNCCTFYFTSFIYKLSAKYVNIFFILKKLIKKVIWVYNFLNYSPAYRYTGELIN